MIHSLLGHIRLVDRDIGKSICHLVLRVAVVIRNTILRTCLVECAGFGQNAIRPLIAFLLLVLAGMVLRLSPLLFLQSDNHQPRSFGPTTQPPLWPWPSTVRHLPARHSHVT